MLRTTAVVAALGLLAIPPGLGIARSAAWSSAPFHVAGIEVVIQSHELGCGPAVIATLLALAGRPVSEEAVLSRAELGSDGISLAEFVRLASLFHLPGAWYRAELAELDNLTTPFVAHLQAGERSHFVAVLGLRNGYAVIADPSAGALAGPTARLLARFSGRVFVPSSAT